MTMYRNSGKPLKIGKPKKKAKDEDLEAAKKAAEQGNTTMARAYLSKAFTMYIKDGNTDLAKIRKKIEEIEKQYNLR
ncbi:MAG: hypothetical protein ACE5J7_00050 [Candidatus Aenigmatarchaeota archaeon]